MEKRADREEGKEPPGDPSNTFEALSRLKPLLFILIGFLVAIVIAELFRPSPFDFRYAPVRKVDSGDAAPSPEEPPAVTPGAPFLRLAVAPIITPESSLSHYQGLARYLGAALKMEPVLMLRKSYAETNQLVRDRKVDLAFVCTYPFIRGEKDFGMEAIAVPEIEGRTTYRSYLIASADSPARSLMDFKGKRFASSDVFSNSGWLYSATQLIEAGENPASFFSEHVITGAHDKSVEAVAEGQVDGAAVDSLVYEMMLRKNPSLKAKVRLISTSPPFGMPPLVVHPRIDPKLKASLRETLLKMHLDPEGEKALAAIGIDKFVVPEAGIYESVRRAVEIWESR